MQDHGWIVESRKAESLWWIGQTVQPDHSCSVAPFTLFGASEQICQHNLLLVGAVLCFRSNTLLVMTEWPLVCVAKLLIWFLLICYWYKAFNLSWHQCYRYFTSSILHCLCSHVSCYVVSRYSSDMRQSLTKVSHVNTIWTLIFLYLHCVSKNVGYLMFCA